MRQTVVGVFDSEDQARQARQNLLDKGFDDDCVQLTRSGNLEGEGSSSIDAGMRSADRDGDGDVSIGERIRNFFSELFGDDDDDVHHYTEAVRRGGTVVRVEASSDEQVDRARDALLACGAVDIDERAEQWRSEGWTSDRQRETSLVDAEGSDAAMAGSALGGVAMTGAGTSATSSSSTTSGTRDTGAEPLRGETSRRRSTASSQQSAGLAGMTQSTGTEARRGTGTDEVIPVVREDLEVGKRVVSTGGVRVYARTIETPVSETVQLREEHAQVERRPVDRPATEADLADLGERTIEVTESAERVVVGKTARVVEEVRVGKTVDERTERVEETLRSTEVQVEQLGRQGGSGRGSVAYEDRWRRDFDTQYAGSGGRWDEYEPAYRYGHGLYEDQRYQGRDWDTIEPDVRRDWESRNPGSAWERFKGAVRRGWDRMTDAVDGDDDDRLTTTRTGYAGTSGAASSGAIGDDRSSLWRNDWQSNYASSGGRFEDYEPAYRYGHGLSSDERYRGRDWDTIEPDVRRDWESRYPGSTWERFKSAVRRGWDNMTQ